MGKTKAEQVAELVGEDIAESNHSGNLILGFRCLFVDEDGVPWIAPTDNPNTAEQIANALRVLAGETVEEIN